MKNAVFTIVAKNYIGLASVLEKSSREHCTADFFIVVADEFDENEKVGQSLPGSVLIAKEKLPISEDLWNELAFRYNLVEFCTAIKPFCYEYLFETAGYEKIIFFDPDILLFNSLEPAFEELEHYSIMLTPHIISMQTFFKGNYPDYNFLINGTFNLGYMGLKFNPTTKKLLEWWKNRMEDQCYFDNDKGMAVDQKWMNMLPSYFDVLDLLISKYAGYNVAPWNYHERKIIVEGGRLFVTNRIESDTFYKVPLVFVHYSGYDYRGFIRNEFSHKAENYTEFDDTKILSEYYSKALTGADFTKYINLAYSYNYFDNGTVVTTMQRRIYRRLRSENIVYKNPFDTSSAGTFYSQLSRKSLLDRSIVSDEKITNKTISGFDKKLGLVNWVFRRIKSLVGIRRYSIMARFLKRYFREENQVYLFDKDFKKKLW